jgi:hypothetical protein
MAELHLRGFITSDYNGIVALSAEDPSECPWKSNGESIINSIEDFAETHGATGRHHKGLGGRIAYIDNCNIRAYFTDKACELEDAMLAMDVLMYGGDIKTRVSYCGYSEWTITGLNLDEFTIGGHDLENEFDSHCGEYCHLIIEC